MSKTGWLVLILIIGGFLFNSHLESKKHIIVQGREMRTGKRVEAEWRDLEQALKDYNDVYIDFGGASGEREIVVLEAYKGNNGNIVIRSDYPLRGAMYQFNKKDVVYVYRDK
jgi:hypothetical protein